MQFDSLKTGNFITGLHATDYARMKRKSLLIAATIFVLIVVLGFAVYLLSQGTKSPEARELCDGYPPNHPIHPGLVDPPEIGLPADGYKAVVSSSDFQAIVLGHPWQFMGWSCNLESIGGVVVGSVTYFFNVDTGNRRFTQITATYYVPVRYVFFKSS